MSRLFGLQIEPNAQSAFQHDYWEEFTKVNDAFAHDSHPHVNIVRPSNNKKRANKKADTAGKSEDDGTGSGTKSERFKRYVLGKAETARGLVFKTSSNKKSANSDETELDESSKYAGGGTGEKPVDLHLHNTNIYPNLSEKDDVNGGEQRNPRSGENEISSVDNDVSTIELQESEEEEERFISVAVQTEMSYLRDVEDPVSSIFHLHVIEYHKIK